MEDRNIVDVLAEKYGVSKKTVYRRLKHICETENKFRMPTDEEMKPKKIGRPRKYII